MPQMIRFWYSWFTLKTLKAAFLYFVHELLKRKNRRKEGAGVIMWTCSSPTLMRKCKIVTLFYFIQKTNKPLN